MLIHDTDWVWDFWVADDGSAYHLFYLHASRALGDERRRHRAARIGHAVSTDLRDWLLLGDVLEVGGPGAFDATATWTGSVVRGPDGAWRMFYTGARFHADEPDLVNTETIGVAVSTDLHRWEKDSSFTLSADARWYETLGSSSWPEEAWRDPWVFADPAGDGWHMLITARANHGPDDDRGVIGHATSPDLTTWTVREPLSAPGRGFAHMEVSQLVAAPTGLFSVIFSCPRAALSSAGQARLADSAHPGVWAMPVDASFRDRAATPVTELTNDDFYSARVVIDRAGQPQLLAVLNAPVEGVFLGGISDPMPVGFTADGVPHLLAADVPVAQSSLNVSLTD